MKQFLSNDWGIVSLHGVQEGDRFVRRDGYGDQAIDKIVECKSVYSGMCFIGGVQYIIDTARNVDVKPYHHVGALRNLTPELLKEITDRERAKVLVHRLNRQQWQNLKLSTLEAISKMLDAEGIKL